MSRFVRRHRLGIAKFSIPFLLAFVALMAMVFTMPNHAGGKGEPPAPPDEQISDSTDLDGSPNFEAIIAAPSGQNENNPDPGQVLIQYDNGSLTIFEGAQDDDWFGASVAVAGDININPNQNFNGDGHADIIVGAPNEAPSGYAYVFYGPFTPGQVLHPADADMKFFPPEEATYNFGINVRQVADIDCDDVPDIGVGGVQPIPGGGGTIGVAYFISGATGEAIYIAEGTTPFNPWLEIVGDAEGDGDVDAADIAIIQRNMGRINPRLTLRDGDFNHDGRITQADMNLAQANMGADHFAAVRGCENPCPNPPPAGYHCVIDCYGDPVLVPINVEKDCEPILCTQDCGCGFMITPMPGVWVEPYWLPLGEECVLQIFASEDANWEITEGEDKLILLPETDERTLVFLTTHPGLVTVTANYYCCASGGWCPLEITMLVTCEGVTNPFDDDDKDGLSNVDEICEYGTDPSLSDSDGDFLPDGWEIENDFDPNDSDGNDNGTPDGFDDSDGDGLINLFEWILGTNRHSPNPSSDVDGDGLPNSCEIELGTDWNDPDDPSNPELDTDSDELSDVFEICIFNTNPTYYDSDADGLPDGWEVNAGLNPLDNDTDNDGNLDWQDDNDSDGLSNIDEWIYDSDPSDPDSDNDGVSDGDETGQGSNPTDPSDGGQINPDDVVTIKITVGDHSGSNSERWLLKVGNTGLAAPGFGEVIEGTRKIKRGASYAVQLIHLGTDPDFLTWWRVPNYDYTAKIEPTGPDCLVLDDPQQLLGIWMEEDCCQLNEETCNGCEIPGCCNNAKLQGVPDGLLKTAHLTIPKAEINAFSVAHNEFGGELANQLEEAPGAFLPVNNDDDDYDEDNHDDLEQTGPIQGESDLLKIVLHTIAPVDAGGYYTLTIPTHVHIWRSSNRTDQVAENQQLQCDENTVLWVEGVSQGSGSILLNWKKVVETDIIECNNLDRIKVTTFTLDGPLNVPGHSIYEYTVAGVNGSWDGPDQGQIHASDGPHNVFILWDAGPAVGKVVYAATNDFVWDREVNVVRIQIDTRHRDTEIDYDNPNIQLQNDPLVIWSPGNPDGAIDATLVVNIEGPTVAGKMRGTRFIDVGFIHLGSWPAMHGVFEFEDLDPDTPFIRVNELLEDSGWHLDYVIDPAHASTPPWADSQAWVSPLPYYSPVNDLNAPETHIFTFLDVPHQRSCDQLDLFDGRNWDDIDEFVLEFSLELYFAVHTKQDVNGSFDVYTQRAIAAWTWNNRAPVVDDDWQGDEPNFQPNNDGSLTFDEVIDGSLVPVPEGPSCNQLLIDGVKSWTTEPR